MKDINKLNKYLQHWREVLNLKDWDSEIKITEFTRTDYQQTGDIEVDIENKKAIVLISKKKERRLTPAQPISKVTLILNHFTYTSKVHVV